MRAPPILTAGSRIALIAPSGLLRDAGDVDRAITSVRRMGWEAVVGDHVLEREGYLAGGDSSRLADLNRFSRDESIDGIWCIRGGYGATRLLDGIDYDAWRAHPKTLIGFSDITALHAAIGRYADLVTFHGPTARNVISDFSIASLRAAIAGAPQVLVAPESEPMRSGVARGRLAGGNLALLAALQGTPYAPNLNGAILVLEDVSEAVYRIDRMLTQLRLAGALSGLAGIAFGHFTEIQPDADGFSRTLNSVLQETADRCGVPCLTQIPLGHIDDQWTLPLGRDATLDVDKKTLTIH
ncbi:MAG: LD-carboxypeptidase [Gemmatimonadaceae bacterium]